MKRQTFQKIGVMTAVSLALLFIGFKLGESHQPAAGSPDASMQGTNDKTQGRKVLYWHDPMVPGHRFDKPGKSPFMDMQLVPVYADEAQENGSVKINAELQQNLGIRFAFVRSETIGDTWNVIGTTAFDESNVVVVQNRATGYIDKLYARSPMQGIKRGSPIVSIFVPEWVAPQEEYLALKRSGNNELAASARQRMRVMSIPDALISEIDRTGRAQSHVVLTSPITGVLAELSVREGAAVTPGMTIAKINGLEKAWLMAEIPETQSSRIRPGMVVTATASRDGDRVYKGTIRDLLPDVNASTRTVQARIELNNDDGSLIPGLLMRVKLASGNKKPRLLIPTEAIITDGRQSRVLVKDTEDGLHPVAIVAGETFGDDTEVTEGLAEGQQIVASGQFLVDSEASLKSVLPKLSSQEIDESKRANNPSSHQGIGRIEQVTKDGITFSHQPIPSLGWGAMTMEFSKAQPDAFADAKPGELTRFRFHETETGYVLDDVQPAGEKP